MLEKKFIKEEYFRDLISSILFIYYPFNYYK